MFFFTFSIDEIIIFFCIGSFRNSIALNSQSRNYSTQSNTINPSTAKSSKTEDSNLKLTTKQKLDILIKDYGKTIIVFHVGISLLSLGGFYFAISRSFYIFFIT